MASASVADISSWPNPVEAGNCEKCRVSGHLRLWRIALHPSDVALMQAHCDDRYWGYLVGRLGVTALAALVLEAPDRLFVDYSPATPASPVLGRVVGEGSTSKARAH